MVLPVDSLRKKQSESSGPSSKTDDLDEISTTKKDAKTSPEKPFQSHACQNTSTDNNNNSFYIDRVHKHRERKYKNKARKESKPIEEKPSLPKLSSKSCRKVTVPKHTNFKGHHMQGSDSSIKNGALAQGDRKNKWKLPTHTKQMKRRLRILNEFIREYFRKGKQKCFNVKSDLFLLLFSGDFKKRKIKKCMKKLTACMPKHVTIFAYPVHRTRTGRMQNRANRHRSLAVLNETLRNSGGQLIDNIEMLADSGFFYCNCQLKVICYCCVAEIPIDSINSTGPVHDPDCGHNNGQWIMDGASIGGQMFENTENDVQVLLNTPQTRPGSESGYTARGICVNVPGQQEQPYGDVRSQQEQPHIDVRSQHVQPHVAVRFHQDQPPAGVRNQLVQPHVDVRDQLVQPHVDVRDQLVQPHVAVRSHEGPPPAGVRDQLVQSHVDFRSQQGQPHFDVRSQQGQSHFDVRSQHEQPHVNGRRQQEQPHTDARSQHGQHVDVEASAALFREILRISLDEGALRQRDEDVGILNRRQSEQTIIALETHRLLEENRQLKDRITCKICGVRPVKINLQPCGHTTCTECSTIIGVCPICECEVTDRIPIILA